MSKIDPNSDESAIARVRVLALSRPFSDDFAADLERVCNIASAAIEATTVKGDGQAADTITTLKGEIEKAYREGWYEGYHTGNAGSSYEPENDWIDSDARQALSQGTDK